MKINIKVLALAGAVILASGFGIKKFFFSSCCAVTAETTSGCTPSNCRGAQTKFGEAKIISDLRLNLIDLKADLEKSDNHSFNPRSYDIHDIIGDTDEQSIEIIVNEVKIIEEEITEKLDQKIASFELPDNKAKQIQYLNGRITSLHKALVLRS